MTRFELIELIKILKRGEHCFAVLTVPKRGKRVSHGHGIAGVRIQMGTSTKEFTVDMDDTLNANLVWFEQLPDLSAAAFLEDKDSL